MPALNGPVSLMPKCLKNLLILAALGACVQASAAGPEDCRGPSEDCTAVGKWNVSVALGAGEITNPLYNSQNIPLVVIPHVSYYGKRFFLDDLDVGFTALDTGSNTLNLIATPGYDRVYFYRTDPQNFFVTGFTAAGAAEYTRVAGNSAQLPPSAVNATNLPNRPRRFTYLAGPEWTFKYAGISGQLDILRDITDQNNGDEVRAALGAPLLRRKGVLSANLGVTWKSAAIVNYYYGEPGIYQGGAAFNPFARLAYVLPLSSKWHFDAFYQYERLGDSIANSPIVAQHSVQTLFVGAAYTF
jgi:MipA family protein